MIHIKETHLAGAVLVSVAGTLDKDSLPILQEVCERHLAGDIRVELDFSELLNIGREGIEYLSAMRHRVGLRGLPEYIGESLQRQELRTPPQTDRS